MRKMMCMMVLSLAAVAASAQTKSLQLSGTSLATGKGGSLNVSAGKAAPEKNAAEVLKGKAADSVPKVTFEGPKSGWGFTKTSAPYYSAEGKNLGMLPGGTLFEYSGVKTSTKSMMLEANVKQGDDWKGPYLLDCTRVAIFEGKPDAVAPETLADLSGYYALSAKVAERKAELSKGGYETSPQFQAAKRAQDKYEESIKAATELNAKAEKQTGTARTKTHEQLRELKYEQTRLKADADKEAANYKAWKDANPVPAGAIQGDAEIIALQKQLAPLKTKLGALALEE